MKSRTAYGEAANAYGVALDKMVDELLGVEKEWPYKITDAYRQGKLSYNNGDFRSHNPYTNTTMCADWFKGFDEGRKLS